MVYKILPTKEFYKDFKRLGKPEREKLKKKVEEVAENLHDTSTFIMI